MTTAELLTPRMRRLSQAKGPSQKFVRAMHELSNSGLTNMFSADGATVVYSGRRYTTRALTTCLVEARAVANALAQDHQLAREPGTTPLRHLTDMGAFSVQMPAVVVVHSPHHESRYAAVTVERAGD